MTNLPPNTEIYYTADGSPTLSFARTDGYREKMHHAGGAISESVYIYLEALRTQLSLKQPSQVLSVGLGLGYNELLTLAELNRVGVTDFKIWSFESLEPLRTGFNEWGQGQLTGDFASVLDHVANVVATAVEVPVSALKNFLRQSLQDGRLELRGSFPAEISAAQANLVFYDAYSKKMDESLWTEDTLVNSFTGVLAPDCVFASYAANGSLNRALIRLGFRPNKKTGFKGKRESTVAIRGRFV
jgi:tRNA U34 5-methylaminomethyl-2-thiouridine-forming methyltransferase MnmC